MPPKFRPVKKNAPSLTSNPPSHTIENDTNHRNYIIRSLVKSDTELAALNKVNTSLHHLKLLIQKKYGEIEGERVLLDIGEGLIRLSKEDPNELLFPSEMSLKESEESGDAADDAADDAVDDNQKEEVDEKETQEEEIKKEPKVEEKDADEKNDNQNKDDDDDDNNNGNNVTEDGKDEKSNDQEEETENDELPKQEIMKSDSTTPLLLPLPTTNMEIHTLENQAILKDFILRMKLRRKLLSRLARRLMRLNHAMDGRMNKINPPINPKYGTSFEKHTSESFKMKLEVFNKEFEEREVAMNKIREDRRKRELLLAEERASQAAQAQIQAENNETKQEHDNQAVEVEAVKEKEPCEATNETKKVVEETKEENIKKNVEEAKEKNSKTEAEENAVVKQEQEHTTDENVDCSNQEAKDENKDDKMDVEDTVVNQESKNENKDDNMNVEDTAAATVNTTSTNQQQNISETNQTSADVKDEDVNMDAGEDASKTVDTNINTDETTNTIDETAADKTTNNETATKHIIDSNVDVDIDGSGDTVMKDEDETTPPSKEESKDDKNDNDDDAQPKPTEVVSSSADVTPNVIPSKDNSDHDNDESSPTQSSQPPTENDVSSSPPIPPPPPILEIDPFLLDTEHQKNLTKLIKYDPEYAKKHILHIPTSTTTKITTALTNDELQSLEKNEDDFDYELHENAKDMIHGIGAVSTFMTKKEKAVEWKRWTTEFLSKIPDQPTFEELGMNRVFNLDQRRERLKKEELRSKNVGGSSNNDDVADADNDADSKGIDEDDNDSDSNQNNSKKRKHDDDDDNEDGDDKDSKKSSKKEKKDLDSTILKQKRICLDPIPSFHQQDYSRTLMIQNIILASALNSQARETYLLAEKDYSMSLQRSQALQARKTALDNELSKFSYEYRMKSGNMKSNVVVAKARWEAKKKDFQAQKIHRLKIAMQMAGKAPPPDLIAAIAMPDTEVVKRSLTAAADRATIRNAPKEHAIGSEYIAHYIRRTVRHSIHDQVATTMAHCVDTVVKRIESRWITDATLDEGKGGEIFPPFVPPTATPETTVMSNGQTFTQNESRLKVDIQKVKSQLETSETLRSKAWSRFSKAKAAFRGDASTPQPRKKSSAPVSKYGPPTIVQPAYSVTAPSQLGKYQKSVPIANNPAIASAQAAVASVKANMNVMTKPRGTPSTGTSSANSKYSLDKVRARIFSDGSVLPVSAPKRKEDGRFMRPAGRQRKNMEWDDINGKWVPAGTFVN